MALLVLDIFFYNFKVLGLRSLKVDSRSTKDSIVRRAKFDFLFTHPLHREQSSDPIR